MALGWVRVEKVSKAPSGLAGSGPTQFSLVALGGDVERPTAHLRPGGSWAL